MRVGRRAYCAAVLVSLALLWRSQFSLPTASAQSPDGACVVNTASGVVRGLGPGSARPATAGPDRGAACVYLGIPYAAPPLANLRWKPPQPLVPWAPAPLNATAPRQCPQITAPSVPAGVITGNEDCLLLNIWTPLQVRTRLPVLVWFHTGAFQAANALNPAAIGERFAQDENLVIVAPNYRLGPFGFLAHSALTLEDPAHRSSGNYGFLDQRAALVWVRDHIAAFGGDPGNVTIAGTSAGSHGVSVHLVSPGSAGLFHRAIMQSGSASFRWPDAASAEVQGSRFAQALGCPDVPQDPTCLRSKTVDQVLRALPIDQPQFLETSSTVSWGPIVDGLEVPDQPRDLYRLGRFSRVPLLVGVNADEGWTYVDRSFPTGLDAIDYAARVRAEFGIDASAVLQSYPASAFPSAKDALSRLTGDAEYVCEARRVARAASDQGVAVHFYWFAHVVNTVMPGRAFHGLETNVLFGNDFGPPSNQVLTAADLALSRTMRSYWRNFAATGNPNSESQAVPWPRFGRNRYALLSDRLLVLGDPVSAANHPRGGECNVWDRFSFRSIVGAVPASAR